MSIALVRASSGAGELTEVMKAMTMILVNGTNLINGINMFKTMINCLQVRRIAQFFRIMRIVRIFKVGYKFQFLIVQQVEQQV